MWIKNNLTNTLGFTMMELIIVIALFVIFAVLVIPTGFNFYQEEILEQDSAILHNNLKEAQSRAAAGKNDSSWGIKFTPEDQDCDDCYVLFMGESYDERDESYDEVFEISSEVEMEEDDEIVFQKGLINEVIIK